MKLREIYKCAKKLGTFSEKTMWQSIDAIDDMLTDLKKSDEQAYWDFMRTQFGIASGNHYDERWSDYDVSKMYCIDKDGKKREGAIYTRAETNEMSKGWSLPSGTTDCDVWVAVNSMAHDLGKCFDKEQICKAAKMFYFEDDDWPKERGSKVWAYSVMKYQR